MHIYGNYKDGTDEPICWVALETQTQRTDLWTWWGEGRVGQVGRVALKHELPHVKLASRNLLFDTGSSNLMLCDNLEEWDGAEAGREVQEEGDICIPMTHSC